MKRLLLLIGLVTAAFADTSVQKTTANVLSNGNIIVPSGMSITATGTGIIAATSIPSLTLSTTAPLVGGGSLGSNLTISIPLSNSTTSGYLSSTNWTTFNAKQPAGNYLTALTGDGTAAGPGSSAFTLAVVATGATVGSSTSIPTFTFNNKGLVTSASSNVVIAPAGTLTGTTLASNVITSSLTALGNVTTGTWNANVISGARGGSGVANTGTTFTRAGNVTFAGAFPFVGTVTGSTSVTFPTTGTLATVAGTEVPLTFSAPLSRSVNTISIPVATNSVSGYLSSADWTAFNAKAAAGNYITALTGDVTATGPGSVAATVAKVNGVTYGTSPSTNTVPVVTGSNIVTYEAVPNAALANSSMTIAGHLVSLGGTQAISAADVGLGNVTNDVQTKAAIVPNTAPGAGQVLVGNAGGTAYAPVAMGGDAALASTGSLSLTSITIAETVGSSTAIPIITKDVKGRITSASTAAVVAPAGTLTGTTLASNVVTSSLTALGNVTTGTWNADIISGAKGGTGVANTGKTITVGGNTTLSGAFTFVGNVTANTSVTFPTTGTLATTAGTVSSITGTANQISASASTGAVTLSIPTNPTLPGNVTITGNATVTGLGATAGVITNNSTGVMSSFARVRGTAIDGVINVRQYGAVCDGVTDDHVAIQAAINAAEALGGDATVGGGATVVIDAPVNFGSATITVGVTGSAPDDTDGKPINLQLAYYGNSIGTGNPIFELASRSRIQGLNRRFTRVTKTGAGPIIQITASAEDCDITDLRLEGGANAVKLKSSVSSGDVPAIRMRRLFAENQTGDAFPVCGMADGFIMDEVFTANSGGAGLHVGVMDGNNSGASNENAKVTNCFFQGAGTKGIWIETDSAALQGSQQLVNTTFDNVQISGPANQGFFFKMLTSGGLVMNNIMITAGPTGAPNTYAAIEFNGAFGGIVGVTIGSVGGSATSNWKNIFKFSGSGFYGSNNLIRSYLNNGATTAVFDLDANCGVRIEDVLTTTGLTGYTQPNAAGHSGLVTGAYQAAGNVGEVKSVFVTGGSPLTLTSDTPSNVATLALTPGNWLISSVAHLHGTASTTFSYYAIGVSTTSATLPNRDTGQRTDAADPTFQTVLTDKTVVVPAFTVTTSGSPTLYLVVTAGFAVSTANAYGSIIATRLP